MCSRPCTVRPPFVCVAVHARVCARVVVRSFVIAVARHPPAARPVSLIGFRVSFLHRRPPRPCPPPPPPRRSLCVRWSLSQRRCAPMATALMSSPVSRTRSVSVSFSLCVCLAVPCVVCLRRSCFFSFCFLSVRSPRASSPLSVCRCFDRRARVATAQRRVRPAAAPFRHPLSPVSCCCVLRCSLVGSSAPVLSCVPVCLLCVSGGCRFCCGGGYLSVVARFAPLLRPRRPPPSRRVRGPVNVASLSLFHPSNPLPVYVPPRGGYTSINR